MKTLKFKIVKNILKFFLTTLISCSFLVYGCRSRGKKEKEIVLDENYQEDEICHAVKGKNWEMDAKKEKCIKKKEDIAKKNEEPEPENKSSKIEKSTKEKVLANDVKSEMNSETNIEATVQDVESRQFKLMVDDVSIEVLQGE